MEAPEEVFASMLVEYSIEFDNQCEERHAKGGEKYGPGRFLTVDTLQEAMDEVIDLANYARYTYIKLRMLQDSLAAQATPITVDTTEFIKAKSFTAVKDKE
jgi:hypothetical protein